jgi:hypothetical protein
MIPKLGICIPYRNRESHLKELIPHLTEHLNKQGIPHRFYVGHQVDDKLFNRGVMKNIAAKHAFEDGCDYVAWHDVDMLPHEDADYSYPIDNPIHIATKLSKYSYKMGYDQYFGGVVLFNKEHVEKTNGYSNDYWDWGQEDDDLFWRCYFEGMTTGKVIRREKDKIVANFNGNDSTISIPTDREISSCLHRDHTITLTFNAEQQNDKVPIYLVGDENNKFIEYPLLRKDGSWTWGLSFNNSRAVTMQLIDRDGGNHYNWAKRFEGLWTRVTLSFNSEENSAYFYVNDELISQVDDIKQNLPFNLNKKLRTHDSQRPFLLGYCPFMKTFFKGKISEFKIYNKFFNNVNEMDNDKENLVLDMDLTDKFLPQQNMMFTHENYDIIENVVPFRRDGNFYCLPHLDEGFVNGKWFKGETTARNEKRFVTEMQQKKIDYKKDGINNMRYELVSIVDYTENCKMINVTL